MSATTAKARPSIGPRRAAPAAPRASVGAGFTLVELMVAITIIAVLAAMALGALSVVRESTRVSKTRSTIAKIDNLITPLYESYRTRRLPMTRQQAIAIAQAKAWYVPGNPAFPLTAQVIQRVQLSSRYELLRLEMPDRWYDVVDFDNLQALGPRYFPVDNSTVNPVTDRLSTDYPSATLRFRRAFLRALSLNPNDTAWQDTCVFQGGSECLYLIVMGIPEAAERFREDEIGDIDGDGLLEFHDAWGNPIRFIRWPAGFVDYENLAYHNANIATPNKPIAPAGRSGDGQPLAWSSPSDRQSGQSEEQHDPFDMGGVMHTLTRPQTGPPPVPPVLPPSCEGYVLYPLIYSAGPDGRADINEGGQIGSSGLSARGTIYDYHPTPSPTGNPHIAAGDLHPFVPDDNDQPDASGFTSRYIGQPLDMSAPLIGESDPNYQLDHYDNIHNHRLGTD